MIKPIKDAYLDLFLFLKKPVDHSNSNQTLKEKVTKLFLILILDIAIAGICTLLLSALETFGLFSMENHKVVELLKTMPKSAVIFAFIIAVPLLEEIIFRLYLRYKTNYLLRFFILLFYVAGKENKEHIEKRIKKIWYKQYIYIFYFSAVLFGFVHVFNFNFDYKMLLLFPILTAPQIFTGIFVGYLRVRYNLIWGYFLHAIHNMILILPFLFIGDSFDELKNTDDYFIKIEETVQSESKSEGKIFPDSVYFRKFKLKDIIANTTNTDTSLIESNSNREMIRELNLTYKNKSDSNSIDRKVINKHLMDLYKYKMNWESRPINSWELVLEDSLKLMSHRTDSVSGSYIKLSKDSAILYRVQLSGIAYAIQRSKSKRVFMKGNIGGRYNIELNTADSTDFKKQLTSIYGLKLVDTVADIEHLIIDFENKK